jgi:hypothetical protein
MKQRLLSLVTAQRVSCILALALTAGVAHAQWGTNSAIDRWANNQLWKRITKVDCNPMTYQCRYIGSTPKAQSNPQGRALPRGASGASLNTGNVFATNQGIERLVASYPAQDQPQIAQTFKTLILTFNQTIPRTYGIPANNLATALAAALAGGYAAYTNQPFPENAVKPLFRQVEQVMLRNPKIVQVSMNEKNAQYQMWVGAGMYLLGWQADLAKHPNPQQQAQMQKAGADALHALGIDPGRVHFTASGMKLD